MMAIIAAEWLKVRRRRMTWCLLAIVPVVVAVLYTLLFVGALSAEKPEDVAGWEARLSLENLVTFGDAMVYRLVALFVVILAGSMTANEYGWRTIITFAAWTGDRRLLLVGKLAATGVAGTLFILSAWIAVVASVVAGNLARGTLDSTSLAPVFALELVQGVAVTWAAAMLYAVVAIGLAVWTRSAAGAIAIPVGVLLLEPIGAAALLAMGGIAETSANFTLSYNIDALLAANGPIAGVDEDLSGYPPAWRGGLFLVMFAAVTGWLTVRSLGHRDILE